MSELKVNTISEVTGANGVVVDSVKLKDGGIVSLTLLILVLLLTRMQLRLLQMVL